MQGAVINQIKELLGVSIRISKKGVSTEVGRVCWVVAGVAWPVPACAG